MSDIFPFEITEVPFSKFKDSGIPVLMQRSGGEGCKFSVHKRESISTLKNLNESEIQCLTIDSDYKTPPSNQFYYKSRSMLLNLVDVFSFGESAPNLNNIFSRHGYPTDDCLFEFLLEYCSAKNLVPGDYYFVCFECGNGMYDSSESVEDVFLVKISLDDT